MPEVLHEMLFRYESLTSSIYQSIFDVGFIKALTEEAIV